MASVLELGSANEPVLGETTSTSSNQISARESSERVRQLHQQLFALASEAATGGGASVDAKPLASAPRRTPGKRSPSAGSSKGNSPAVSHRKAADKATRSLEEEARAQQQHISIIAELRAEVEALRAKLAEKKFKWREERERLQQQLQRYADQLRDTENAAQSTRRRLKNSEGTLAEREEQMSHNLRQVEASVRQREANVRELQTLLVSRQNDVALRIEACRAREQAVTAALEAIDRDRALLREQQVGFANERVNLYHSLADLTVELRTLQSAHADLKQQHALETATHIASLLRRPDLYTTPSPLAHLAGTSTTSRLSSAGEKKEQTGSLAPPSVAAVESDGSSRAARSYADNNLSSCVSISSPRKSRKQVNCESANSSPPKTTPAGNLSTVSVLNAPENFSSSRNSLLAVNDSDISSAPGIRTATSAKVLRPRAEKVTTTINTTNTSCRGALAFPGPGERDIFHNDVSNRFPAVDGGTSFPASARNTNDFCTSTNVKDDANEFNDPAEYKTDERTPLGGSEVGGNELHNGYNDNARDLEVCI
jgi:hypothetical protein